MTETQKIIKYFALALAIFLIVAIIGGVFTSLSFISLVFTDNKTVTTSELSDYSINYDVDRLYIDLQAADLEIKNGADFSLQSNHEYLKVEDSSDSLSIKETKRIFSQSNKGYKVVLTIPESKTLQSITINTGAGKFTLSSFTAKALKLSVGAGEVVLNDITVTDKTEFEGGAGEITVNDCSFTDMDMEIGVGECSLSASLLGDSKIDCGVGEAELNLISTPQIDYTISVEKGLGEVTVDGKNIKNEETIGFGENEVEINCGVGEVHITLTNQ